MGDDNDSEYDPIEERKNKKRESSNKARDRDPEKRKRANQKVQIIRKTNPRKRKLHLDSAHSACNGNQKKRRLHNKTAHVSRDDRRREIKQKLIRESKPFWAGGPWRKCDYCGVCSWEKGIDPICESNCWCDHVSNVFSITSLAKITANQCSTKRIKEIEADDKKREELTEKEKELAAEWYYNQGMMRGGDKSEKEMTYFKKGKAIAPKDSRISKSILEVERHIAYRKLRKSGVEHHIACRIMEEKGLFSNSS